MMNDNNADDYTEPTEDFENSEKNFTAYEESLNNKTWHTNPDTENRHNSKYMSKIKSSKYSKSPPKKNKGREGQV
jgi:hypothetical protein